MCIAGRLLLREFVMRKFKCNFCGHFYDEAVGDADTGIPAGTPWEDIPDDWACPECGATKADYELIEA